jgi:hypothetical protein
MDDHKTIWLQPWCPTCRLHNDEGRQWCEDNVWEDGCEECQGMPVKYTLADDQPKKTQLDAED